MIVKRTKGASAAFIKELMRRCAQYHFEMCGDGVLQQSARGDKKRKTAMEVLQQEIISRLRVLWGFFDNYDTTRGQTAYSRRPTA